MTKQIDEQVQVNFTNTCKANGQKSNEVLEALMQAYINGEIKIKSSYSVIVQK